MGHEVDERSLAFSNLNTNLKRWSLNVRIRAPYEEEAPLSDRHWRQTCRRVDEFLQGF